MTNDEYVQYCLVTKSNIYDTTSMDADLVHSILGVVTESGELADIVKRAFFYGKGREGVDVDHIKEEAGDLLWYLAIMCANLNVSFEELMIKNIAKLKARYPNKFETAAAYNRNLENEKSAAASIGK